MIDVAVIINVIRPQPFILITVDKGLSLFRRPTGIIQLQLTHHPLDQPQLVIRVQNLKVLRQARLFPMHPQQAVGDAVKGTDPHGTAGRMQQGFNAMAHFGCRLIGKGDRQNTVGG